MGSAAGVIKVAAACVGLDETEYRRRLAAGLLWCTTCKDWHPADAFAIDRSRARGRTASCRDARNRRGRDRYEPRPRPEPGRKFVPPRDGDKLQARRRVNYLVESGLIPAPNDLPCTDCGHVGTDRRHEYDHHLGYAAEHHEHVEPVCTTCHHAREASRGREDID